MIHMKLSELKHKKIAILGFGKEGQSTLRFLQKQGIEDITILDAKTICLQPLSFSIKGENSSVDYEGIKIITGPWYLDTLWDFDLIIKTPGISPFHEKLRPHRAKFISQTQIFFENYTGKVIGITGTKGKSTTSTLLYEFLMQAGYRVKLVGNIGTPVLDEIPLIPSSFLMKGGDSEVDYDTYDYIVYEMSSYMLQDFVPKLYIGVFNNIYPCHLDWHFDSWNIYKEAKLNILQNAEYKVINGDFSMDADIARIKGTKVYFSSKGKFTVKGSDILTQGESSIHEKQIRLLWEHNRQNITAVLSVMDIIMQDSEQLQALSSKILPVFQGLPHRIEDIGTYEGIRFIDDAIATTPESTIAAIETFDEKLETLFLWGQDSGFHFEALREKILRSSLRNIIAFPDTSEKIFPEIELRDYEAAFEIEIEGKTFQMIKTRFMKTAVDFAYRTTLPGRTALLSCAAPSFSLWKSYLDKAAQYQKEVKNY